MKLTSSILMLALLASGFSITGFTEEQSGSWKTDFFDDFDSFNADNWQDQMIWVNNEFQCYVPDNQYGTREVGDGSIKLKVINIGDKVNCDNLDKQGKQHPDTPMTGEWVMEVDWVKHETWK
jgi:hypothetical protein